MIEHPAPSAMMAARVTVPATEPLAAFQRIPRKTALAVMSMPTTEPAVIVMSHFICLCPCMPGQDGADKQDIFSIYLIFKIYLNSAPLLCGGVDFIEIGSMT
jgi:hypothetical protein